MAQVIVAAPDMVIGVSETFHDDTLSFRVFEDHGGGQCSIIVNKKVIKQLLIDLGKVGMKLEDE